ncbi:hypothetical protein AHF37_03219, partial [Paragonimus kellicotti]
CFERSCIYLDYLIACQQIIFCIAFGLSLTAELGDAPPDEDLELSSVHENLDISVNIPENPHTPSFTETRSGQPNSSPEKPGNIRKDTSYLAGFRIFLSQTPKMEAEIMKRHQQLRGLTSQEAETEFLNRTSQLPTFGIDRFPIIPHQSVSLTHGTGDENKSKSPGTSHSPVRSKPVQIPKGVAYYMGITDTGLVLFVGLQRSQEDHWSPFATTTKAELGDAPPDEDLELSSVHENLDISVNIPENPHTPSFTETRSGQPNSSPEKPGNIRKDTSYLAGFRIFLSQTPKMEAEIMKRHQQLRGLTSQEAETEFLNRTSQLPTFGIDRFPIIPHQTVSLTHGTGDENKSKSPGTSHSPVRSKPVQIPKGVAYYMGITDTGLVLFVGLQRSQEYHWDEIHRLACDGKHFLVYLKKDEPGPGRRLFWVFKPSHHTTYDFYGVGYLSVIAETIHSCFLNLISDQLHVKKTGPLTFECESKAAALALWHWTVDRKCFFTLKRASEAKRLRPSSNIFQRNKTYRFSGRSHQELNSIQITDTKSDFIRVSSLRHTIGSASVGHTTFPSRIRPPLDLKEIYAPKETVDDHILSTASTEAVKAVLVPDTVIEQPVEDDSVTLTVPEVEEQVTSEPDTEAATEHVPEPPIEAKQIPQQLAPIGDFASESNSIHAETSEAMEIRKRLDPSMIHAVVCEQVVSALDRTIDTLEVGLGNADANKGSSIVNDKTLKINQRNGPYCAQPTTVQPPSEDSGRRIASPELIKTSAINGAAAATVTAVVVMLVVGLIVIMETNPTTNSTVLRFMRSNAVISGFDSFIYSPLRNAITAGLSIFWSKN